jgi:diguanylate cyclase (GGDEF)-like protein
MAVTEDTVDVGRVACTDPRDQQADARDRQADERDRQAEGRRRRADERDQDAEAAERTGDGVIDLRERRSLRRQVAVDREASAHDRAVSADDRRAAALDREMSAHARGDADEEREILRRDELTGLLQRGVGITALEREVARSGRSGEPVVVAFIDVDGLKHINDEQGHASGDAVLRTLGEALRKGMRVYDIALRYGGDEVVCVLPGFAIEQAVARFDALRAELAAGPVPVSVTVGLAEWRPGETSDAVLARADAAMYGLRDSR